MKERYVMVIVALAVLVLSAPYLAAQDLASPVGPANRLPRLSFDDKISVEKALAERRSTRTYKAEPLTIHDVSQILWAGQGITEPNKGLRTAPSARALYLLEVYLISGDITGVPVGTYRYQPSRHGLVRLSEGNARDKLHGAAGQTPIKSAPAALVITGYTKRSTNQAWDLP